MLTKSTLIVAVVVATIGIASPAFAQSFSKSWGTEFRQGDYYAPSKTVVQQATPQEQNAFREGDFYAPTAN
jgi:hypothetical protein